MNKVNIFTFLVFLALVMGCGKNEPDWFDLVKDNKSEALREVVSNVDVNEKDEFGMTALHYAAYYGYVDCIDILIKAGAEIFNKDSQDFSPLEYAVTKGRYYAVHKLLAEGAPSGVNNFDGNALVLAVQQGNNSILRLLLRTGFDVHYINTSGWNAISLAVKKRDRDAVEILLNYGADPNYVCTDGTPIIQYSVSMQESDILALLLSSGGTNSFSNAKKYLHTAIVLKDSVLLDELVGRYGLGTNDVDILEYSASMDNVIITDVLSKNAAASNSKEVLLGSALISAIMSRKYENVDILIKNGADLDYVGKEGITPLVAAIGMRDGYLVERLIRDGADVRQVFRGKTMLELVSTYNAGEFIEELIKREL